MDSRGLTLALVTFLTCVFEFTRSKVIDLSHVHGPDTLMSNIHHPRFNKTYLEKGTRNYGVYVESGWYSTSDHGGTHMDAPSHFKENGMTLDEIPIEYTILDGVMIDSAEEAMTDDVYGVPLSKIHAWEAKYGRIPDEAAVLFNFNWSRKFSDEEEYKGSRTLPNFSTYRFPYVTEEAAMWLLRHRKPRLIGSDTLTPDPFQIDGQPGTLPIHVQYLPRNRLIIENLRDLWQLPPRGFRFHATPVAFQKNTGSPIRAFAMTYETEGNSASSCLPLTFLIMTSFGIAVTLQFA